MNRHQRRKAAEKLKAQYRAIENDQRFINQVRATVQANNRGRLLPEETATMRDHLGRLTTVDSRKGYRSIISNVTFVERGPSKSRGTVDKPLGSSGKVKAVQADAIIGKIDLAKPKPIDKPRYFTMSDVETRALRKKFGKARS